MGNLDIDEFILTKTAGHTLHVQFLVESDEEP